MTKQLVGKSKLKLTRIVVNEKAEWYFDCPHCKKEQSCSKVSLTHHLNLYEETCTCSVCDREFISGNQDVPRIK